mgnify:CR=1 FL=1
MINASIIIPTYDRPDLLVKTISSALEQSYPRENYEIIVIDNSKNSTATSRAMGPFLKKPSDQNFRYIKLDKIGVHYARNKGAQIAQSDLLIFTDDDCILSKNLISSYISAFKEYPNMDVSGGPIKLRWETPPPKWLYRLMGDSKVFYMLSKMEPYDNFHLDKKGFFFSANIAIKKKILFKVGGFNPELVGNSYVGDGETGLYKKLWQQKILIGYVPQAIIFHQISQKRITLDYFMKRMVNEGASNAYSIFHSGIPNYFILILRIIALVFRNIKLFIAALFYKGKTDSNSLSIQLEAYRVYGQIIYMIRLLIDKNFRRLVLQKNWLKEI